MEYTTLQGDTFDSIAYKIYGNRKYTKELMEANTKYLSTLIFSAGITLKLPEIDSSEQSAALPPWRK